MTKTVTKKDKKATAAPIVASEGYKQLFAGEVNLSNIEVQSNFRKTFNEKLLKELAENIAKVGVLQPVILRQVGEGFPKPAVDGQFILVAGERRLRAASLAGLTKIPARILDLNEEQAAEVQALENLHRKDLSPIEEARAFKVLLDQKGHTLEQVEDLAARVGKSASYVYKAVRLTELPNKMQERIETGELTPAHGHQLLRLPPEKRAEAEKEINWNQSVKEVSRDIERELGKSLSKAHFPTNTPYAGLEACTACIHNSSNQEMLFSDAEKGKCINVDCFQKKHAAFIEALKEKATKQYEGLKFLGVIESYSLDAKYGRALDHKQANSKEIKAARKENPGDFAWVILDATHYYDNTLKAMLVCVKPKDLSAQAKKAIGLSTFSSNSAYPTTSPKQKFIRMETYKALFVAARATLSKGLQNEHYAAIAKQLQPGQVNPKIPMEMLNVQVKKGQYSWEKNYAYDLLTTDELRDLVLLLALNNRCSTGQDPDPKIFAAVGVNTKLTIEAAKKKAAAEWEAKKSAKKAKPDKKGKKPAQQDRDADSGGNSLDGDE